MDRPDGPSDQPSYTMSTRTWLDQVYAARTDDGHFVAHEPIFGFGSRKSSPWHAARIARAGRILSLAARERFSEGLDVGAGESYIADLIREKLGVRMAACDLSREACLRGRELFGSPTFAADAARLPLADRSFDLVLCCEVIEHLEDPFVVIAELLRIARRALVITTSECCHLEWQRRLMLKLRPMHKPHVELNWWMPGDFPRLIGPSVELRRQLRASQPADDRETDMGKVLAWLNSTTRSERMEIEGDGIIVIWRRDGGGPPPEPPPVTEALWQELLQPRPIGRAVSNEDEEWLAGLLRCPVCRGELAEGGDALECAACSRSYPCRGGLPDLTVDLPRGGLPLPGLDSRHVARLRRLFDRGNVWTGWRAPAGRLMLRFVELIANLRAGRGLRASLRTFRTHMWDVMREISPSGEGTLMRAEGTLEVYRIEGGRRRYIVSEQVFHDLGYAFERVRIVEPGRLEKYPVGEPIGKAD